MLSFYSLVLSVIACVVVGTIVLVRNQRDTKTIVYGLLTIVLVIMSIANFLAVEAVDNQLFFIRAVMFTSTVGVYLIYVLTHYIGQHAASYTARGTVLLYLTLMVAIIDWSDMLFPDAIPGHPPTPILGPAIVLYFGHFLLIITLAIRQLLVDYKKSSHREKQQRKLLVIGSIPILFLAPVTSFVLPNIFGIGQFVALTPLYAFIFVSCVGYAIVRHGLFDIKLVAVRSAAYFLSLLTLAGIYYAIAYLVSIAIFQGEVSNTLSLSPINIFLALVLAFIFQPIKQFFDRVTDRVFFRNRYDTEEFISRLGEVLTSTTELNTLLKSTARELQATLKASYAVFTVFQANEQHVMIGAGRFPSFTAEEQNHISQLAADIKSKVLMIGEVVEPLAIHAAHKQLLRTLERRRVALMIPLGREVGYLLLGEALSSYTQRDIKTLSAINGELLIAIQNARSVQEVRDLNTYLQQRIDHATQELRESNSKLVRLDETKDEFISMASHQLRTPLTSIKGYLSMVLEGDMGKINPAQQKVLSEAYSSSERMVRLIGDFLNVSRLQTGKFVIDSHPTDLTKLIDEEVDAMQRLAESHGMTLVYKRPRKFPILNVDADKLRQVIMNFIDNAIYYSRPNSTIVIKAYVEHDDAIVEVHDQGIGVPEAEQAQLFTKFFRAENARRQRPDGTGVGLFLARKVVTAQSGEVVFSSRQGKGSVFGFRLPIKKLAIKK